MAEELRPVYRTIKLCQYYVSLLSPPLKEVFRLSNLSSLFHNIALTGYTGIEEIKGLSMQLIAWAFYLVLVVTYLASAGFIVFHILRYSLCRSNAITGTALFLFVFTVLFVTNVVLFSAIPLDTLLQGTSPFPQSSGF